MELKNLENLKEEIAYLEEAEELLQAIYSIYGRYELWDKLSKDVVHKNEHLTQKLESHFNFDEINYEVCIPNVKELNNYDI